MTPSDMIVRYNTTGKMPIDIVAICKNIGINVLFYSESNLYEYGKYSKKDNTIYINKNISQQRQNFICAHMIYHMLDKDSPNEQIENTNIFNNKNITHTELQANKCAAELLMPLIYIKILVLKRNIYSPLELSKIFNVSEKAMMYRLEKIGAFDDNGSLWR